ncbi:MAG: sugar phosphate isomerase/epimerase [Verrucomicrobiales bacterium]|nr:sugar phosphate isomerase/epimerase [Verrucomicrobiales bacterium]
MRVGVLCRGEPSEIEWVHRLGFRSIGWMRFAESACGPNQADWKPSAEELAAEAKCKDVRISAIGAFYANPLDPLQTGWARQVVRRAVEVAAHLGVKTVTGFAGGVIETRINDRGGNPVSQPLENSLPQLLAFWEPLAEYAREHGVRIGFENCPQGTLNLPIQGYNSFAKPALWELFFNATKHENIGLEWDPSHLICQWIDPVQTIHRFGSRIFHVHAKDAYIDQTLLARYGVCHPGVSEHRLPGFGQANWPQIVHALVRAGYDSDLNIEGRHDPVFRDHPGGGPSVPSEGAANPLAGRKLEERGLLIAKRMLEALI